MKKALLLLSLYGASAICAADPQLMAIGRLSDEHDLSGLTGTLENGVDSANVLGGIGSGLAYAGNNTFLALPDRGPNATEWNADVDNTTSYISRFHTVSLQLTDTPSNGLPMTLAPQLQSTTLLFSPSTLTYGAAVPDINTRNQHFFSGRSDNFGEGVSTNPSHARLDPEAIRVGHNGKIYISDEYGPYVYEFDRLTGKRTRIFSLPAAFTADHLSAKGADEIAANTQGRVANKGMEGLAMTPDGGTLIGFEQSPLLQDGGDGGRTNRIVTIDIETGKTHQYVYDNYLADKGKSYNSSEILAINDHEFLVLERDGKGLGDGSKAVVKRLYKIDLKGATDIGPLNISGENNLLPFAVEKSLFLDIVKMLNEKYGIDVKNIPAKLEGIAFGSDVVSSGVTYHTLWIANDNDFLPTVAGGNLFYVVGFTDQDLIDLSVKDGLVEQKFDRRKPLR
ncbi:esterase-like activity of phytase family protein [Methylomicrobium sp. Wu6]|uniref:esterase-like activity of phytase family protein n=1 Tax=Methylomicrobium sp. Wu6 TaxID=3107928 RepID=UPI002DD661EB|nr:esterase-like activity of phytase family protein [Methylomicrobium sp. Wu6]MEC4750393.1 esterase-like activity of phytase family protein [Methylomicrobium sp. Wu6]